MNGVLALATALSQMDRDELETLVRDRLRRQPPDTADTVALAMHLLKSESVLRALAGCRRPLIDALHAVAKGEGSNVEPEAILALRQRGLIGEKQDDPVALPEVMRELRSALTKRDDTATAASPATSAAKPEGAAPEPLDWVTPAFLAAQQSVLLLKLLEHEPSKVSRSHELGAAARNRFGERIGADPERVRLMVVALRWAGLTDVSTPDPIAGLPSQSLLRPGRFAWAWALQPHPVRWFELAASLVRALPVELRDALLLTDHVPHAVETVLPHEFPLLTGDDRLAARLAGEVFELFGLTVAGHLSPPAKNLLSGEFERALGITTDAFPDPVDAVYVQPDLSIISPGPLRPEDGLKLLQIADITGPGIAASLAITEATLVRALDAGWSTEEIRSFLSGLSLTGLPQPLEFLLDEVAGRHGSLLVEADHERRLTLLRARDPRLIDTLLVDRSLRSLGLIRDEADDSRLTALSRISPEHVQAILVEERYPATLHEPHSTARGGLEGARTVPVLNRVKAGLLAGEPDENLTHENSADDWVTVLVDSIVQRTDAPGHAGHLQLLELAARTKTPLRVTVEARGATATFHLVPLSVANGRLRALDQQSDLERTLPVEAITQITELDVSNDG